MRPPARLAFIVSSLLLLQDMPRASAEPDILFWQGTSVDVNLGINWDPEGPPDVFLDSIAYFGASGVADGLTPGGEIFSAQQVHFSGQNYTWASAGPGDSIAIGGSGGSAIAGLSSSVNVHFNDQPILLSEQQTWNISGNSTLSILGTISLLGDWTFAFSGGLANVVQIGNSSLQLEGHTLIVSGWNGTPGSFGGANNQLRFGFDPTPLLGSISFTGYGNSPIASFQGSYWEVVPVPEPAALLLAGLGFLFLVPAKTRTLLARMRIWNFST